LKRFGTAEEKENMKDKWCIQTVFKTIWNYRENNVRQGREMVHSGGILNDLELQRNTN